MSLNLTDDELVNMTTSDLRLLLEQNRVTAEEHKELRNRRRRLQNRRYARKCASKKQSEVDRLTTEVQEEVVEIRALRDQLSRTNLATKQIEHQLRRILEFKENCLQGEDKEFQLKTIRMLHPNGQSVGLAYVNPASSCCYSSSSTPEIHEGYRCYPTEKYPDATKEISTSSGYHSPAIRFPMQKSVLEERQHYYSAGYHPRQPSTPSRLTSGPGFPGTTATATATTSSGCVRLPCKPPCHFRNHLEMRLVRPVGGGFTSHGRGLSEY
ncbi:unnamed protein product [Trichobilharzia szidati]|nr:unnamed protein product [Trichobilharzia szidati]